MALENNEADRIYVAVVKGVFGKKYAMHHCNDRGLMPHEVVDYSVSADRISGYIDGLTINTGPNVKIFNGIPADVRSGWFPNQKLRVLRGRELENILGSRFNKRVLSGKIHIIP